ncbi:MAG: BamA/TamA family outer membrane protein [Candidatus Cloacimonetes bacterium]|nr:BamA/TamA family outer membrane protein [Candidatus Cloacimonadota bacterium]MCF7813082.1 BamA/TamA family outer membrane protein [Candidatus Cloacimonadota bacterium]MCF7867531.1 BamA/TamA family outer membrane protein [Candidatus Cloacimonadota bacterium]MCF7883075.1 BamA/TamA family outer membrane protein [Candidatus Cloacimonadota bacterium]
MSCCRKILLCFFLLICFASLTAQEGYYLKSLKITGNKHVSTLTLKDKLYLTPNTFWRNLLFWKAKHRFHQADLALDLQQMTAAYQKAGFLHVQIQPEFVINEEKESVEVILKIQENDPVLIEEIVFDFDSDEEGKALLNSRLPKFLDRNSLQSGQRFRDKNLEKAEKEIMAFLQKNSYPFSEVGYQLKLNETESNVMVKLQITTGTKMRYGKIEISGNDKISETLIRQQISFASGEYFHPRDFQKTQKQIQQLNMFRYVTVQLAEKEKNDDLVDITINVQEAPRLTAQLAVGYGWEERFRTEAKITKLGFLGGIRRAALRFRHSYLEPYNVSIQFDQPAVFHPNATYTLQPYLLKLNETGYDKQSSGIYSVYQFRFARYSRLYLDYDLKWNNLVAKSDFIEDELLEEGKLDYQLSSFGLGYTFENSQPLTAPDQGWFFSASAVLSGLAFYSDYNYYQLFSEVRKYTRLTDSFTLANRLKYQVMQAIEPDVSTPLAERFYAGGKANVRGWSRSDLGPLNEDGVASGGNSLLEASLELRYPIYKILSGVVFLDAANIWKEPYEHDLKELQYAVGGGIRIKTPIGSLRLDAAMAVWEEKLPVRFYFSIGEAF